jgi:hypothetical protein
MARTGTGRNGENASWCELGEIVLRDVPELLPEVAGGIAGFVAGILSSLWATRAGRIRHGVQFQTAQAARRAA